VLLKSWVHNPTTQQALRIDPATNNVVARVAIGQGSGGVAIGDGAVWVLSRLDQTLWRIDPQTNRVAASIKLPAPCAWITLSPNAVWVISRKQSLLVRIDPRANRVVATIQTAEAPKGVAYAAGSIWVCNSASPMTISPGWTRRPTTLLRRLISRTRRSGPAMAWLPTAIRSGLCS
jgi:virginiamycin B lyase